MMCQALIDVLITAGAYNRNIDKRLMCHMVWLHEIMFNGPKTSNATFSFKARHESKVVAPELITRKPWA